MKGGLNTLVYRAEGVAPSRDYVRVLLDRSTGEPLPTQGLRGMLAGWRDGVAYDVRVEQWVDLNDMDREVRLFATQERVTLRFSLRLMAQRAKASQVVSFFHDKVASPAELLLKVIANAIVARAEAGADYASHNLVQRISADRDAWEDAIAQAIGDATGLAAQFRFDLGVMPQAFPEVRLRDLDVQVSDAPHRLVRVHVHVVLEATRERVQDRLPADGAELRLRMEAVVRGAFRDRILLFDCWFDQPAVEQTLKHAVDLAFRGAAHVCRRVQIEPILPPLLREEHVECKLPWRGPSGREIEFYVEAKLGLRRDGVGRYTGLNLKPRGEWFAQEARRVLDIAMAGRDFWTLSKAEYAELKEVVNAQLAKAAAATGQDMLALVAEPLIPENRWLETQHVELTGQSFKTRNGMGFAEFDVMLEVQFPSIQPLISSILHNRKGAPGASDFNGAIEQAIRDVVRDAVTSVMSQVELKDYFVGWDHWDDADRGTALAAPGHTGYVPAAISRAINRALSERFNVSQCLVRLRREDRKVQALVRAIAALGPLEVEFAATPRGLISRTETMPVTLRFMSDGPDLERLARTLVHSERPLHRQNIEATLKGAAQQFLLGLDAAQIRGLAHGQAAPGLGTERLDHGPYYAQLEEHVSSVCVEAHGFPVRLQVVAVGESASEAVARDRMGLSDEGARLQNINAREEMVAALELERLHRRGGHDLLARDYEELLSNRRQSNDDRVRFRETTERIERNRSAGAARLRPSAPDIALNAPAGPAPDLPPVDGTPQEPPAPDEAVPTPVEAPSSPVGPVPDDSL